MYLYHFSKYAGTDRVFTTDLELGQVGDLVMLGEGEYGFLLGDEVARPEMGKYALKTPHLASPKGEELIVVPRLLSEKSLGLLHRFVNEWYTTYKNSISLWVHDVEDIVKRNKKQEIRKKKKKIKHRKWVINNGVLIHSDEVLEWQQLIIFPDLWTLKQVCKSPLSPRGHSLPTSSEFTSSQGGDQLVWHGVVVLHGKSTKKQKSEAFLGIKSWAIATLICTYSQIFQDWQNLQHIILIDQHKRYYKHQQDPRYYVPTVVEKMAEIYGAHVTRTGQVLCVSKNSTQ